MLDQAIQLPSMEALGVALIGAIALVMSGWLQARKTRRINSEEHDDTAGAIRDLHAEVRDIKAGQREFKQEFRDDISEVKGDIKLIKDEAQRYGDRLDSLEKAHSTEHPAAVVTVNTGKGEVTTT